MVLYAGNKPQEIKMTCPHCHFVTRYDANYLEYAIKYHKWIWCVACDKPFRVVFQVPDPRRRTTDEAERAGANGLQTCPCGNCSAYREVVHGVMEKCEKCGDNELDLNALAVVTS